MRALLCAVAALAQFAVAQTSLAVDAAAPPGVTVIHLTEKAGRMMRGIICARGSRSR